MPLLPSLLRSSLAAVLDPVSPEPFSLIWSSHPRWPLPLSPSSSSLCSSAKSFNISILDSSFNPPTLAHLSLLSAPLPGSPTTTKEEEEEGEYDAHLLLLSVKNVDKVLGKGDASFEQRLQMIHLLATSLLASASSNPISSPASHRNLAIGILSEPAFIAKDVVVRAFLKQHCRNLLLSPSHDPNNPPPKDRLLELIAGRTTRLAWLVGTDTMWRFFDAKYYPPTSPLLDTLWPFFSPPQPTPPSPSPPELGSLLIHFARLPHPPAPPSFDQRVLEQLPAGSVRKGRDREGIEWGQVSSTVVRARLKKGEGLEWLVSEGVREYLEEGEEGKGLYR